MKEHGKRYGIRFRRIDIKLEPQMKPPPNRITKENAGFLITKPRN